MAGSRENIGSIALRWDPTPYTSCEDCTGTQPIDKQTFQNDAINYCEPTSEQCVWRPDPSVNCTASQGLSCFSPAPSPPPPPSAPFVESPPSAPGFITGSVVFNQRKNYKHVPIVVATSLNTIFQSINTRGINIVGEAFYSGNSNGIGFVRGTDMIEPNTHYVVVLPLPIIQITINYTIPLTSGSVIFDKRKNYVIVPIVVENNLNTIYQSINTKGINIVGETFYSGNSNGNGFVRGTDIIQPNTGYVVVLPLPIIQITINYTFI
jgi:hypothetical protein